MGGQQSSQQLNPKHPQPENQEQQEQGEQQQPGQRHHHHHHHHFHHFLTRRPSIGHLERCPSTPFPMNKICRSSSHSYPYPRTHTLVVVPPSRPVIEDEAEQNYCKARPPLNRAIPTIPESKSNDSIMTHISERHGEVHAEPIPSTSCAARQPSRIKPAGQAVATPPSPPAAKEPLLPSRGMDSDGSLVIENRMAQNLATKTAVIVSTRARRPDDVPRSPLMSVAHSVRTKLTKLGSRFSSRSDGNQNIRTSTSLSSMRRGPGDKNRDVPSSNIHFKKSASMETRTAQNSASMDSIKSSIPCRQTPGSGTPSAPRISGIRNSPSTDQSVPLAIATAEVAKTYEKGGLLSQNRTSKLARPKNLSSFTRSGNNNDSKTKANSVVKAFAVRLEPRPTSAAVVAAAAILAKPPDRIRKLMIPKASASKIRTSTSMDDGSIQDIREARIKPTMNVVVKSNTEQKICLSSSSTMERSTTPVEPQNNENDQQKAMSTSRQRSFIPLYITAPSPRQLPARTSRTTKIGRAPLAECESSCIENSPAVEIPSIKFISDKIQDHACMDKISEDRTTTTTTAVETPQSDINSSATNSVRGDQNDDQFSSSESAAAAAAAHSDQTARKQSVSSDGDENGDCWTPSEDVVVQPVDRKPDENCSPDVPSANGACDSDAKSGNSPNEFVSPTAMTSSGFTTSSGFQESPDKSPDKDAEFEEQFSDMTITQAAGRSRSRRPPPRDLDRESVVSTNSVPSRYKNQRYDEASSPAVVVNKPTTTVAFPNMALYESSCNDVAYMKSQLLDLQSLINNSVEAAECTDRKASKKMEDNDVIQRLLEENDALRKELLEKDRIITSLKAQILLH